MAESGVALMDEAPGEMARPQMPWGKVLAGGIGFLALTVGVFSWLFSRAPGGHAGPALADLRWGYLPLILLVIPVETLAAGLRMWIVSRTLQPGVRFGTCIRAELANAAMNLLTPAHSGGGPAQIYMLTRTGVRAGTALTISLVGFLGTMVGLTGTALYCLLTTSVHAGPLFLTSVGAILMLAVAMTLGAACPDLLRRLVSSVARALWVLAGRRWALEDWWPPDIAPQGCAVDHLDPVSRRLVDLIFTYRDDVHRFIRVGGPSFLWVCLLSTVFLGARVVLAILSVRFLGLGGPEGLGAPAALGPASLRHIAEIQLQLIFIMFFAPTPGGAGIAEGASFSIMADVVPAGVAPYYNLLWRFSTAYLAAMAGLLCLGWALVQDASRIAARQPEPRQPRA
jgi:glycosyltransferase 2 family protein